NRSRAVGRTDRTGDEAAPAILLLRPQRRAPRQPGAVAIKVVDSALHLVVGLRDPCRGERIGLQDIGTRHRIAVVDILDRLRLRQDEQIVVALLMAGAAGKALAAEMRFVEPQSLDLGPHGTVDDQDAFTGSLLQGGQHLGTITWRSLGPKELVEHRHLLFIYAISA